MYGANMFFYSLSRKNPSVDNILCCPQGAFMGKIRYLITGTLPNDVSSIEEFFPDLLTCAQKLYRLRWPS